MRVLVTRSKGQLGCEIRRCLEGGRAEIGPIPAVYAGAVVDYVDLGELDIADGAAVDDWFSAHLYDLVVNCAAYTDVDGCEGRAALAFAANALGLVNLARAAARQGAAIAHVSTGYVIPGNESRTRREDDLVDPASAYGRSKLAGEWAVRVECPRHFVCRTAWLYGYEGRNFVKAMRRLGAERDQVEVVCDQRGNPTSANDLAYEMLRVAATANYGTYHMTNRGECGWADLAARVMERSGLACEVVPVTSGQYKAAHPGSANRPRYSGLDSARLRETVGDEMRPWEVALDAYLENLVRMEALA